MKNEKGIEKRRRYIKLALETNARKTAGSPPGITKVKPDGTDSSRLPNKITGTAIKAVNPNIWIIQGTGDVFTNKFTCNFIEGEGNTGWKETYYICLLYTSDAADE